MILFNTRKQVNTKNQEYLEGICRKLDAESAETRCMLSRVEIVLNSLINELGYKVKVSPFD